jgi:hypothetical protein
MDTRSLGYLGLGALVVIVLVTLVGVPPAVWITAVLLAGVVGLAYAVLRARASGVDIAARMVALADQSGTVAEPAAPGASIAAEEPATAPALAVEQPLAAEEPVAPPVVPASPVEVALVRPADARAGKPAVWLHRFGGRRVHRYQSADTWVVEQVSTKDPDNPKKRTIGEPLTFASEAVAIAAADDLAQGIRPDQLVAVPRARQSFAAQVHA